MCRFRGSKGLFGLQPYSATPTVVAPHFCGGVFGRRTFGRKLLCKSYVPPKINHQPNDNIDVVAATGCGEADGGVNLALDIHYYTVI